jgi:hypothetical protein
VEGAPSEATGPEATTAEATTMESAATTKAAGADAASVTTSAASVQHYRWRNETNRRNCQQRDHRLAQHNHSPSEISHPTGTARRSLGKIAISFDESVTQLFARDAD